MDDGDFLVREGAIHRVASERDDDLWADNLNLLIQERCAHIDFFDERVAVSRWTTLDDVGDIDCPSIDASLLQQLVQESARRADKWNPLLIFVESRGFTDKHQRGIYRAIAGNRMGAPDVQLALCARSHLRVDVLQSLLTVVDHRCPPENS
jgi:hypothetical protein